MPIIPNRPLKFVGEEEVFGEMLLRENRKNLLVENAAFDPELICYGADYQNNQCVSASFAQHTRDVLEILKAAFPDGAKLVEVGCGKGDFLEMVQADGYFKISGYDGAYEGDNPDIEKRFLDSFDEASADLVILRHVLEHIQRPHEFLKLLSGIFEGADIYIEVPEFDWIRSNQTFFDITYEHVNYFTTSALSKLFASPRQQGVLFGDQYQFIIGELSRLNLAEYERSYDADETWSTLSFDKLFPNLMSVIAELDAASQGRSVYVWGAATKGVMFCHHLKRLQPAVHDRVRAAVDINPMKANRFMPSAHLPILDVDSFCRETSGDDLVVIMNPNYRREIMDELQSAGLNDLTYLAV